MLPITKRSVVLIFLGFFFWIFISTQNVRAFWSTFKDTPLTTLVTETCQSVNFSVPLLAGQVCDGSAVDITITCSSVSSVLCQYTKYTTENDTGLSTTNTTYWKTDANPNDCVTNVCQDPTIGATIRIKNDAGLGRVTETTHFTSFDNAGNWVPNGANFSWYFNPPPIGYQDGVDNNLCSTSGWTFDPDGQYNSYTYPSINVAVWRDANLNPDRTIWGGTYIEQYSANVLRQDVNNYYSTAPNDIRLTGKHGFNITFDSKSGLGDGKPHPLYVLAIDPTYPNTQVLLNKSPTIITCVPKDDLSITWYSALGKYDESKVVTVSVTIKNSLGAISTAPSAVVGFWPAQVSNTFPNNCPTSQEPPPPYNFTATPALAPGASVTESLDFNVGTTPGIFYAFAYVNYNCTQPPQDYYWGNNITNGAEYIVYNDSWFKTGPGNNSGDIGSGAGGNMHLSYLPSGQVNTDYLIAAQGGFETLGSTIKSTNGWSVSNYSQPLGTPTTGTSVYQYLWDHFHDKVEGLSSECAFPLSGRWHYCNGNVNPLSGTYSGDPLIWFIKGNLTITGNVTNSAVDSNSLIIVASGDITINSAVTEVDAVMVSNGTIHTHGSVTDQGKPLAIYGAIYASNLDLSRRCDSSCSDLTTPSEVINYQPRYLNVLKDWLGTPSISWQEVAP